MRPRDDEYASFYGTYVQRVPEQDPLEALENATAELRKFLPQLPEEKADYRYAAGKWTVKELVQHMSDTERIMAYRALTIARGDSTPLPGFDENTYALHAGVENRSLSDLAEELFIVRQASLSLFKSFDAAAFKRKSIANNSPISVLGLAYIICGHQRHHLAILQERYFPDLSIA